MNKVINYENLRRLAYSNDELCKDIKGIVLEFSGCSIYNMYHEHTNAGKFYAKHDILYVIPYYNPWAWMNKPAVEFVDEIVDVLFKHFNLDENTPIASTGGSMGGQGAIVYTARAKRTPAICISNCPNADLSFGLKNNNNHLRTLYSAFWYEDGDIEDVVKKYSPIDIVDELPESAEYHLFHGDNDESLNYTVNSKRLYEKMLKRGLDVTFMLCKGRGHATVVIDSDVPAKQYILDRFGISGTAKLAEADSAFYNHDAADGR